MKPAREEFAVREMTKGNRHRRTGNGDLEEGNRNQELETNETRNLPFNWFGATASAVISMRPREWRGKVMQTCLEPRAA
jgi:hypothetical protein